MAPRWSNEASSRSGINTASFTTIQNDANSTPPSPFPQPPRTTLFLKQSPLRAQLSRDSDHIGCTRIRHFPSRRFTALHHHHRCRRSTATKPTPASYTAETISSYTQIGEISQPSSDTLTQKNTINVDSHHPLLQISRRNSSCSDHGCLSISPCIGTRDNVLLGRVGRHDVRSVSHLGRNHTAAAIVGAIVGALFISVALVFVYSKAFSFRVETRDPHLEQSNEQTEVHPLRVLSPAVPDTVYHPDSFIPRAQLPQFPLSNRNESQLGQCILPVPHLLHDRWSWVSKHTSSSGGSITFPESISTRSSLRFLHLDSSSLERHSVASGISSTCSVLVFAQPAAFNFVGPTGFYGHSEVRNNWDGSSKFGWSGVQPLSFIRERPSIFSANVGGGR